jgi:hypothetical protein
MYSLIQPTNGLINKFSLYPTYVSALIWPSSEVTCYVHFTYHRPFGTVIQLLFCQCYTVTPDDGQIKAETYVRYSENLFISAFVGWMSEY